MKQIYNDNRVFSFLNSNQFFNGTSTERYLKHLKYCLKA
jgi:hypothetical protein